MFQFYRGATFNFAGVFQLDGTVVDFSGWTITAALYDALGTTLIDNIVVTVVDATKGLYTFTTTDSTSNWPVGKAQLATQAITNTGQTIVGSPILIRIVESPITG